MEWSPQQADAKPLAFIVTLHDGRSVIAFGKTGGTAKNRGAKALGSQKSNVASCYRAPELDNTAPSERSLKQKIGRPLPAGAHEREKEDASIRCCTTCGEFKQRSEFNVLSKATGELTRQCKACRASRWSAMTFSQRVVQMVSMARHRAKKSGIPFDLKPEDITIPYTCPVLGIPIQFSDTDSRHNSPSLDRLVPELGYTPGNVLVVSWLANDIKRNFNPVDIVTVGEFYRKLAVTRAAETVTVVV